MSTEIISIKQLYDHITTVTSITDSSDWESDICRNYIYYYDHSTSKVIQNDNKFSFYHSINKKILVTQQGLLAYLLYKAYKAGIFLNTFVTDKTPAQASPRAEESLTTPFTGFTFTEKNHSYLFKWDDLYFYLNLDQPSKEKLIKSLSNLDSLSTLKFEIQIEENTNSGGTNIVSNKKGDINECIKAAIKKHTAVIFTGAPGTGKTFTVRKIVKELCSEDKTHYKFVQFHPSYDYTDFVEGLKPVQLKNSVEPTFVRLDGIFKKFCRDIVKANKPNKPYYFIIDEINRADLSKVFGELMFCLEKDYRGSDNTVDTQYQYLKTYEIDPSDGTAHPINNDVFKDGFYIPENLKIIGTMNDIDRSVDSIDFALRRRFRWIDIKANDIMKESLKSILSGNTAQIDESEWDTLTACIVKMNKQLTDVSVSHFGFTDAYHIGPAYFKDYEPTVTKSLNENSLMSIFDEKIEPIIREYTRGRDHKQVDDLINKCRSALIFSETNT